MKMIFQPLSLPLTPAVSKFVKRSQVRGVGWLLPGINGKLFKNAINMSQGLDRPLPWLHWQDFELRRVAAQFFKLHSSHTHILKPVFRLRRREREQGRKVSQ